MSTLILSNISIESEGKPIVGDVSLSITSGEIHVLMGPNGSGKSSLVNGIMGHPRFKLTQGLMSIDGEDVTKLSTEKKAQLGIFLSQQYLPEIPGVTLTNFLFRAYQSQKGGTLSVLDFYKMAETKAREVGIDPAFLKRQVGSGLSGGEKKLTEILQMLVLEPKFAILDEIDSGVDVDALKKVLGGIKLLREKGVGFLLITHYDALLREITPDHVHVMQRGKLVASGGRDLAEQIQANGFDSVA